MNAEWSAAWVRRWVGVYTRGLPSEVRQDRIDEIDGDLWSQLNDAPASGPDTRALAGEIVARLIAGIPADLTWRLEQRGARSVAPEKGPSIYGRNVAILAVIGGVAWVLWSIPTAIAGWAAWGAVPLAYLIPPSVLAGAVALPVATIGLVFGNIERLRGAVAAIAAIGGIGGMLLIGSVPIGIVVLPIGSGLLMLELGRIGVVATRHARLHAAAAVFLVLADSTLPASSGTPDGQGLTMLCIGVFLYAFTWIPVGWSLRSGAWMPEERAAGA